ncbi:thiopurine S-methyltransferase [Legionella dresdenensis]|uniref:Thiopurine S-methyltransferase n=1 Tax=Legionella dresdenensis TaxID=450200 RepID=A0ABV8CHS4_9GAMM
MNRGQQFWQDLWLEGRLPFHRNEVNADLIRFWPELKLAKNATVLVPLCGKSLDLLWLVERGYRVVGIELSELAIEQFMSENGLILHKNPNGQHCCYSNDALTIWSGDIFTLDNSAIPPLDAFYDRAALVALPQKLRADYVAKCLQWLKPDACGLLKTLSYDQNKQAGPPYSVSEHEVQTVYNSCEQTTLARHERSVMGTAGEIGVDNYVWLIRK